MPLSRIDPYLDIIMQHLSDLMVAAATWPDATQSHLYSFWVYLDQLTTLLFLPHLPVQEIRACLTELWVKLDVLDNVRFGGHVFSHLDMLRKALIYVSYSVDELLCRRFEFPVAHLTSRLQAS
jgi:hypothetical protein